MLSAYDTEKRLQAQGLAPKFSIEIPGDQAGPSYFDSAVKQVGEGIGFRQRRAGQRDCHTLRLDSEITPCAVNGPSRCC